jgi:hypothetical protein
VVPAETLVLATADRGMYARWLFACIRANGWVPLLRINTGGNYRPEGETEWRPLAGLVQRPGQRWVGRAECFSGSDARLTCTLVAWWAPGAEGPWVLVTSLSPAEVEAAWYSLRMWIEAGFRDVKSDGFRWMSTRTTDPARVERQWLVLAVAMLWALATGTAVEAVEAGRPSRVPPLHISHRRRAERYARLLLGTLPPPDRTLPAPPARLLLPAPRAVALLPPPVRPPTATVAPMAVMSAAAPVAAANAAAPAPRSVAAPAVAAAATVPAGPRASQHHSKKARTKRAGGHCGIAHAAEPVRRLSCFARGLTAIVAAVARARGAPAMLLLDRHWPTTAWPVSGLARVLMTQPWPARTALVCPPAGWSLADRPPPTGSWSLVRATSPPLPA